MKVCATMKSFTAINSKDSPIMLITVVITHTEFTKHAPTIWQTFVQEVVEGVLKQVPLSNSQIIFNFCMIYRYTNRHVIKNPFPGSDDPPYLGGSY